MIRKHIYYSGHVQGVGFRFTTAQVANGYMVFGYVRNMPDRRVEVVVEGESKDVTGFLDELAETMAGYISGRQIVDEPYAGQFDQFEIRY